jgi:hypothetical protein
MEAALKTFLAGLKGLRLEIKGENRERISKKSIRDRAAELASMWFNVIAKDALDHYTFAPELIEKYSGHFKRLIKLTENNNLKSSYLDILDNLTHHFRDEFILPLQRNEIQPRRKASQFSQFVAGLSDADESAYFKEALDCADQGFLRAAAVMGWSAAIDRIHRKIERSGFAAFNTVSAQMASQTKGRYKHFNQKQNIASLSELREVFDNIILWIIEGMGLIDSNQHTRLKSCFEMRCQCAHPGEAPITEYNLMSFFSDIQKIVLENSAFTV